MLFRIHFLIYLVAAVILAGLGSWTYIRAVDVVDAGDPALALTQGVAPIDIRDLDMGMIGPVGEVAIMAQINDSYIMELGPVGEAGEVLYAYPLFSVYENRNADQVNAAIITNSRARYEQTLQEQTIGTAAMGPLYNLSAYKFHERRIAAAVIGALSEQGLSSGRDFIMLRPRAETDIPATYLNPTRSELIVPLILFLGAGLALILGLHNRSLQRRGKVADEETVDPILMVDGEEEEGELLRKRR